MLADTKGGGLTSDRVLSACPLYTSHENAWSLCFTASPLGTPAVCKSLSHYYAYTYHYRALPAIARWTSPPRLSGMAYLASASDSSFPPKNTPPFLAWNWANLSSTSGPTGNWSVTTRS